MGLVSLPQIGGGTSVKFPGLEAKDVDPARHAVILN